MKQAESFQIQTDAAKALAEWKAFFAEQVVLGAKELARDADPPCLITLDHYRKAAAGAAQALATAVQDMDSNDGRQEAA